MNRTARVPSELTTSRGRSAGQAHRLPVCAATGLARYRDRHQARDAARAVHAGSGGAKAAVFGCPQCRGHHLEKVAARPVAVAAPSCPTPAFTASLPTRRRRYMLVDIENCTRGARASAAEVKALWGVVTQQAPGVAPGDHVVIGAARGVARRYRHLIQAGNVRWVVGADGPDGADRALLGAIDLRRVAESFDELVIMSGDHAFVDLARRAKAYGLTVHVVTVGDHGQRSVLSRDLSAVADIRTRVRTQSLHVRAQNTAAITTVARTAARGGVVKSAAA